MRIVHRIPTFIKMCENDLGEEEHIIRKPITFEEYQEIERLTLKLTRLLLYVDSDIFKESRV